MGEFGLKRFVTAGVFNRRVTKVWKISDES